MCYVAQFFSIHPDNPQPRLIRQASAIVRAGGVIVCPTDSCYALGGQLGDKNVMSRIRVLRGVDEHHHFTLMCRDFTEISRYAKFDDTEYRLLKACTPGCYTFIFQATREVPRRLLHPRRKTIGLPWHLGGTAKPRYRHAPLLGEHNQYVLRDLAGLSDEDIARLTAAGALE